MGCPCKEQDQGGTDLPEKEAVIAIDGQYTRR